MGLLKYILPFLKMYAKLYLPICKEFLCLLRVTEADFFWTYCTLVLKGLENVH